MNISATLVHLAFIFFLLLLLPFCISLETTIITPNQPLKDGDILFSTRKIFALGFFSPPSSHHRYVGIWYHQISEQTVVWVANRDSPINDTSGILAINNHGRLIIYGYENPNFPFWSSNSSSSKNPIAKLLDVGNLVLLDQIQNSSLVWQSFDYPTNTMLPYMKLGLNRPSGLDRFQTSWKSTDDPGTGSSIHRIDLTGYPQLFLYKDGAPWWRGGPWTGHRWSGIPEMTSPFIFNVSFVNNRDEISITYGILNDSILTKMTIEESGLVVYSTWQDQARQWYKFWSIPTEACDTFSRCGPNGNCDPSNMENFECMCLPGFEPKSTHDWALRYGSGGCVRKQGVSTCGKGEGFVKVTRVKVPDTSRARVNMSLGMKACERECLRDCSCTAYTSADDTRGGIGCLTWYGDLVDTRTFSSVGQDLYVRVDAATLVKKRQSTHSFSTCIATSPYFEDSVGRKELGESARNSDLSLFGINTIAAATSNFSDANKLGEGGFGPVYKGVLYNGMEIAVKRLSKYSGQGNEEFKNEVMLIANLQHRNLVRILGCCVHEEEKMLIYEYLPNKSLDFLIFGETNRKLLGWRKRFDIICGVARGILYLHQDSRLRIIHRDLKASNVLLDAEMVPKIADFGMARIFGKDQTEANTNRVVGTYGYISPEYAMEGMFSVKSDVYSFGVLMLEIVAGRRNSSYYNEKANFNMVGHVWELWREGKCMEILDSTLDEEFAEEAWRCVQIGLLCVQEYASDRPDMSAVVVMLGNNITTLPHPKAPAFMIKRSYTSIEPSTSEEATYINEVNSTIVEGR